jgi:hypothetical protein
MLEEARTIFESWGIRIGKGSRLEQAQKLFRKVARNNAFPADDTGKLQLGRAYVMTHDLVNIAQALPDDVIPALKEDLRRCLGGSLNDSHPTPATRAQSQLSFGAVLAAAGLNPKAPPTIGGKSPDYIIVCETLEYGVEIKRPQSVESAFQRIDEAVAQFREFGSRYNCVVVDMTDCVDSHCLLSAHAVQQTHRAFEEDATRLSDYIHRRKQEEEFSRICLFIATAREVAWEGLSPRPQMSWRFYPEVFPEAAFGLVVSTSRRIRSLIQSGYVELGGRLDGFRDAN